MIRLVKQRLFISVFLFKLSVLVAGDDLLL